MKKINLHISFNVIVFFVCSVQLILLASCSAENQAEAIKAEAITKLETLSIEDKLAVSELIDSIDKLDAKYPSTTTRGGFWSNGTVGLADAAGWAAGGAIGSWAGGAIGSAGGPCGTIAGHLIGRRVGPYVCTFLASGVAGMVCSSSSQNPIHKKLELTYVISEKDSIGYYHNDMMLKIGNNRLRYEKGDTINYDLMYQDIISYLRDKGEYDAILDSTLIKYRIINQIKGICEISQKYKSKPLSEGFVDEQCEYLKAKCNLSDTEIKLYKDFNVTLYKKCSLLPDTRVVEYTKDLNQIIKNSKVSEPLKESLEKSADLTINSSLYWKKNL